MSKARCQRRKRRLQGTIRGLQADTIIIDEYLSNLREAMLEALRHKFGAEFTPALEAEFRRMTA